MAPPAISPTGNWIGTLLFVLLAAGAITLFATRARELVALLVKARPENRTDHMADRIGQFFLVVLGQSGVLRDPIPGIAHFLTFWGFLIIQLGLLNLMLGVFNLSLPVIGDSHVFAAILDIFIILVTLALLFFAYRRAFFVLSNSRAFCTGRGMATLSLALFLRCSSPWHSLRALSTQQATARPGRSSAYGSIQSSVDWELLPTPSCSASSSGSMSSSCSLSCAIYHAQSTCI